MNKSNTARFKRSRISKNISLVLLSFCLMLAGRFAIQNYSVSEDDSTAQNTPQLGEELNLNPATEEEKKESEDKKDKIVQDTNKSTRQQSNISTIKPTLNTVVYGYNLEVSTIVSGVFEDGGTCTAKLSKDSYSFEKSSNGQRDARYTYCTVMLFDTTTLQKGRWNIFVTYKSQTGTGVSNVSTVEIK